MQSMLYLLFQAILLVIVSVNISDGIVLNGSKLAARVDPSVDPAFTDPDYTNPFPLHMPGGCGPMFRSGWEPDHCLQRDRAQRAFLETGILTTKSTDYIRDFLRGVNDGSMFTRYFSQAAAGTILNLLVATFFNVKNVNNVLIPVTAADAPLWNPDMKYIDVRYGAFPVGTASGYYDLVCRDPRNPFTEAMTQRSFLSHAPPFIPNAPPERTLTIICRYAFVWPDLPAIDDELKCEELRAKPYLTCSQYTLSGIMFHEILHDTSLHDATNVPSMGGGDIVDFKRSDDPINLAGYPDDGYGPWNAIQLQKLALTDPRSWAKYLPVFNADSYAMFALEVFWSKHCDVVLTDPPSELATQAGLILPDP